jgi:hypothetical protein
MKKLNYLLRYRELCESEGSYKEFEYKTIPCRLIRNGHGNWCGYIALNSGDKYFEASYDDIGYVVHGGITFSDYMKVKEESVYNDVDYWWIGFDTAHSGDVSPIDYGIYGFDYGFDDETYKDLEYCISEVKILADQLYDNSICRKIKTVLEKI